MTAETYVAVESLPPTVTDVVIKITENTHPIYSILLHQSSMQFQFN